MILNVASGVCRLPASNENPDCSIIFLILYHVNLKYSNPSLTNDTKLGIPCTSLFGAPVSPSIVFGGYDGNNYTDSSVLVVTIVIKNHDDDSKNDKAKAWEKAFISYLKKYDDPDLEIAFMAERSIEDEIERESHADIYTIIVSYIIMFLYITIALGQINQCDRFMVTYTLYSI